MNKSDIEFTIGLNTSPAEQQLNNLYNDAQTAQRKLQKIMSSGVSSQVYDSKLDKMEKLISRAGNDPSRMSSQDYHRFTSLRNDISRYERIMGNYERSTSKVVEQINSLHSNKEPYRYNDIFKTFLETRGRKETNDALTQSNKIYTQGVYEQWKKTFVPNNILALPAPKETDKNTISDVIQKGDKPLQEENKKDNEELKNKLFLWGKIFTAIYAVKKLVSSLTKFWKFGAENATNVNGSINDQLGYFSVDPVGALNANIDKTRSLWYAGVANMGENSPVSKAGLDVMAQKFTDMWTAAMSGRQVDTRTTIDAQRLKEFFGIDFTVAGLLTGRREGKSATDIQRDAIIKVENQISKLAEVDEVKRGQLIDSLRNLFGDELINAIVTNFNKRLRSDSYDKTVIEQIETYGKSTFGSKDLTEQTMASANALSNLRDSLASLRNTVIQETSPAFTAMTNAAAGFVDWINKKITTTKGEKDETGGYASSSSPEAVKSAQKFWFDTKEEKSEKAQIADVAATLKNANSAYDVADVIFKTNPLTQHVADIESLKKDRYLKELGKAIASGNLSADSKNELISGLANYEYGGKKGLEAFKLAMKNGEINFGAYANNPLLQKLFNDPDSMSNREILAAKNLLGNIPFIADLISTTFGEGGAEDVSADTNYGRYILDPNDYDSAEAWYEQMRFFFDSIKKNKWGREFIKSVSYDSEKKADTNKNGVLDFGEVKAAFKITLTDQYGRQLGFAEQTVSSVQ